MFDIAVVGAGPAGLSAAINASMFQKDGITSTGYMRRGEQTNNGRIVIFGGGVPLTRRETIIGGFGVSGGSAEQDTALADYALELFQNM